MSVKHIQSFHKRSTSNEDLLTRKAFLQQKSPFHVRLRKTVSAVFNWHDDTYISHLTELQYIKISCFFDHLKDYFRTSIISNNTSIQNFLKILEDNIDMHSKIHMPEDQKKLFSPEDIQEIFIAETLSRLSYRMLHLYPHLIPIPIQTAKGDFKLKYYNIEVIPFEEDSSIFAYGLTPIDQKNNPPIVLFRGTTLYPARFKEGVDTVKADFSPKGVGYKEFTQNKTQLDNWLKKNTKNKKAIVLGHSLGGTFALLTAIHMPKKVQTAKAFNAPGVDDLSFEKWEKEHNHFSPKIQTFNTPLDLLSSVGKYVDDFYFIDKLANRGPLTRHNENMTSGKPFKLRKVSYKKINADFFRRVASELRNKLAHIVRFFFH